MRCVLILTAVFILCPLDAAEVLSDIEAAKARREANAGRTVSDQQTSASTTSTTSNSNSYTATDTSTSTDENGDPIEKEPTIWTTLLTAPPPEGWRNAKIRTSVEIGWHNWDLSSSSGNGNQIGSGFETTYEIDPVVTLRLESAARLESWSVGLDYEASPGDGGETAQRLFGQASRIHPGGGAWWTIYGETGHIEGTASSQTFDQRSISSTIDTTWERVGVDWRRWTGISMGLVYENLEMPTILTLEDPDGPVVAIFDDTAAWQTVSFVMGFDSSRRRISLRQEGLAFDGAAEVSIGVGHLSYAKDVVNEVGELTDYSIEANSTALTGAIDLRLGGSYTKLIGDSVMQCYAGGRLRAAGWINGSREFEDGDSYDTLVMDASLGLLTTGVFARLAWEW